MRLLMIHADDFSFKVTGATAAVRKDMELPEELTGGSAAEVLVAFIAVEDGDEKDPSSVIEQGMEAISDNAVKVGAAEVMVYPFAHLSSSLSTPRIATRVLDGIYNGLYGGDFGFEVKRAPFGWYKGFEISCKGHPLSELAATITPGRKKAPEEVSEALAAEKERKAEFLIITPEGDEIPLDDFDFKSRPEFKIFVDYDLEGSRLSDDEPAHIRMMRKMELVDYEPGSDPGNFRWYPKGFLIKRLMEDHVSGILRDYGAMQVETPLMYDYQHPNLKKYMERFPARQYVVKSDNKEYFLRFAACFGQYLMKHDMGISHRQLPLRLYELTHYSFRREQSGELSGLKRLRTFTMPDMHTLAGGMDSAKEEFERQFRMCIDWMKDLELPYELAFRSVRSYYDEHAGFMKEMARVAGRPFLLELWDDRFFYFIMKCEFNTIDSQGKASTLPTVQIDVENTSRFDITYTTPGGGKENPLLLHSSISGSIDRVVYGLLERQALKMKKGEKANFPLWLAPTQVRIIPVSELFNDLAEKLLDKFNCRVDVDDRNESLSRRIRTAEKEWVPFICVVGAKEQESGLVAVRTRDGARQKNMSPEELDAFVKKETEGKPFIGLNLPRHISRRPIFHG